MSDTEAMVRLMEHAADLLQAAVDAEKTWHGGDKDYQLMRNRSIAAKSFACATLRMVAASVAPEGRGTTLDLADRIAKDYPVWAEESDGVVMTDGELGSVARFLRSTLDGTP